MGLRTDCRVGLRTDRRVGLRTDRRVGLQAVRLRVPPMGHGRLMGRPMGLRVPGTPWISRPAYSSKGKPTWR